MRVIKPLQLSLQHKTFRWNHKHYLSVSQLLGFRIGDKKEVLSEQDLWRELAPILGTQGALDACMPKPQGEVLVFGNYHSPNGQAVTADRVELSAGSMQKTLAVIGNRYWRPIIGPTPPEPFTTMPIDYAHAFGGPNHAHNTHGKGIEAVDYFGEMRQPLPNIEHPNQLVTDAAERPAPAGFGPLDMLWQPRVARMGSYDDNWRLNHFPGLPTDIDWRHFMTAPEDQWLADFWRGDEDFSISNMHPDRAQLRGHLPGFRTRCIIEKTLDRGFREIEMQAETLYLYPAQELAILLYRGSHEVDEDDTSDIENLLIAYEDLTQTPRSLEHYCQAIRHRLDEKTQFKYMMNTRDLIPDSERCGFDLLLEKSGVDSESIFMQNIENRKQQALQKVEDALKQQREQIAQKLESAGVDPTRYLEQLQLPSSISVDDPLLQKLMQTLEQILPGVTSGDAKQVRITDVDFDAMKQLDPVIGEIADAQKQQVKDQLLTVIAQAKGTPAEAQVSEKIHAALDTLEQPPELPRPSGDEVMDALRNHLIRAEEALASMRARGVAEADLPHVDPDIETKLHAMAEGMQQIKDSYRSGAHYVEGRPPHKVPLDILRHRVEKALTTGDSLRDLDLAGVDLSGLDLSRRDLSGCYLEYANLSRCNLTGARLDRAILTHANLSDAKLGKASLIDANLGDSLLQGADLTDAITSGCELGKARLNQAKLVRCDLADRNFLETDFADADCSESNFSRCNFLHINLNSAVFTNATLKAANFVKCQLNQADFSSATLDEANFVECHGDGARFVGAQMRNARLVAGCSIRHANFNKANLDRANLRDSQAEHANFELASLNMADLSGANLQHAKFYGAIAKRALFIKSDLKAADVSSVNLMEGSLLKARLTHADLRHSNLYAVEFMDATVGGSDFTGANLDLSKLEDWRPSA